MNFDTKYRYYIAFGICIFLGVLFHWNHISEYPSYIHAWAQADHYSITLGFLDNGLNFFKPQTLMYNHQFPNWWTSTTETGITSVDFPLHHYMPAVFMKLLGIQSPAVSRIYILLYSILGLFGVYKLTYLFSNNHLRSLFVMAFAAMSPVFVYYQAGFFPSVPSLANAILGVYFYFNYIRGSKQKKHFYIGIVLLTLAALSRTTFVIPLIAVFCNEFLRIVFKETDWKSKIIPAILSFGAILGYYMYNAYLRETYSSIFIGYLLPPESWADLWKVVREVYVNWFWQYLSKYQYGFILALIVGWIIMRKKIGKPENTTWVLRYVAINFIGVFMFTIAMSHAYIYHDYYFLDTYFLPTLILVSLGCSYFPKIEHKKLAYGFNGLVGVLLILFCVSSIKVQKKRRKYSDYDMATFTKVSYEGSKDFLTDLGVTMDDKILAVDICAPNLPFVMMDRRGHGVFTPTKDNMLTAFEWDFDYVVTQNGYFIDRTYGRYPDVLKHLSVIGNNGRITVSKFHKEPKEQSLNSYLFSGGIKPFYKNTCDFNSAVGSEWTNVIVADSVFENNPMGIMKPEELYGITLIEDSIQQFTEKSCMFRLKARVFIEKGLESKFTLRIQDRKYERRTDIFKLSDYIDASKTGTWQDLEIVTMLPVLNNKKNTLSLFLWNTDKDKLYLDDVSVELY